MQTQIRKAEQIGETYRYMTRYMLEGARDDGRGRMLEEMCGQILNLADEAMLNIKGKDDPGYYYSVYRFNRLRDEHVGSLLSEYSKTVNELSLAQAVGNDTLELRKRKEGLLERLFDTLMTSLHADSDYSDLSRHLTSPYADADVTAQALSALTLGLLFYYDRGKLNVLLDVYEKSESNAARARALIGVILTLIRNKWRVETDRAMLERLSTWKDSLEAYTHILEVVRVIIATRDTERVTNKIQDELLPELMKLRPELMKSIREHPELDASMLEDNPEWSELLNKSGLDKKMQELSELHSEGADLMMATFSRLKQFPFFNKASNWFLPFDIDNTQLNLSEDIRTVISMLTEVGAVSCDSDIYSLALASNHVPKAQIDMMSGQIKSNFEQFREQQKADTPIERNPEFNKEALRAVRDLYRFFKLFRKSSDFYNPFAESLRFTELPVVGEILADNEVIRLFGEFYFKRGYYSDALPLMQRLSQESCDDATLWEKTGFCFQQLNLFAEAKEAYDKAALLKEPGAWLTNKLAYVNRRLGNYAEAARHYAHALSMDPENLNLIMNAGNMMLESDDIAGALGQFYHANYLSPDNPRVLRAVAWVELLNGNYDKSSDYYRRAISVNPQASDYLNSGHVELLRANYKEALNFYRLSAAKDPETFEAAFMADLPVLTRLGADKSTALILLDLTQTDSGKND